jgi:gluconate 5-dehydrogenase
VTAFDFSGKVAVVTGAARGIGLAVARAFEEAGAAVASIDVEPCPVGSFHRCDVSREEEVEAAVETIERELGPIQVLFNNAGVNRRIPLAEWRREDWEAVIGVNFVGSFLVARAVGLRMAGRGGGAIVNMSALGGGVVGLGRGTEVYTGTKGAVAAMTRDLAAELAKSGVRVNAVAPGWIETEMNAPLMAHPTAPEQVRARIPLRRWGTVEDVVGPVLFLASDASRYITGHLLPIDGGAAAVIRIDL